MLGIATSTLLALPLALGVVVSLVVVFLRWPTVAIAAWLCVLGFVPIWCGVNSVFYFLPASAAGFVVIAALVPGFRPRLTMADFVVAVLFVSCLVPAVSGGGTLSTTVGAFSQWLVAFMIGRMVTSRVDTRWLYGCLAIVFTVVALLAIVEFLTRTNFFVSLGPANALHVKWGVLQGRSRLLRAEGAFGHSIALGCSLALALPVVLSSRFRLSIRLVMVTVMLAGVAVTFSRTSIVCSVLAVVISVLVLKSDMPVRVRATMGAVVAVVMAVLAPTVLSVFDNAGDEALLSAAYRGTLTELIPDFALLGLSDVAHRTPAGELYFGRFQSIDNQLILTGLTYGWFVLGCGLVLLVMAGVATVRRVATAPTVAIVAQIPALITVAFITQYSMVFWFMVGLAVATQAASKDPASDVSRPALPISVRRAGSRSAPADRLKQLDSIKRRLSRPDDGARSRADDAQHAEPGTGTADAPVGGSLFREQENAKGRGPCRS